MKRLLAYAMALTMLFAVGTVNAQKASKKKTKTKTEKTVAKTEKTTEKKAKTEAESSHLTKSGKLDKRYKENKEMAAKDTKTAKTSAATAAASESKATASRAKATAAKTADQVDNSSKGPHGETVYTGPRGGKYFINKNGKKEYLSSLKKH